MMARKYEFIFTASTLLVVVSGVFIAFAARILGGCSYETHELATARLHSLAASIQAFHLDFGRLPAALADLVDPGSNPDGRGAYVRAKDLLDPWQRPIYYRVTADPQGFQLFSLGNDGRIGGDGANADAEVFEEISSSHE